jgi:hypothetical protein
MRRLALAVVIFALGLIPAEAAKIGGKGLSDLARMDYTEAANILAGQTILLEPPKDPGYHYDRQVGIKGRFVVYLTPGGLALAWSKDSEKVVSGQWSIAKGGLDVRAGLEQTGNLLCIGFPGPPRVCLYLKHLGASLKDSAQGNIFNLKAGAKVSPLPKGGKLSALN